MPPGLAVVFPALQPVLRAACAAGFAADSASAPQPARQSWCRQLSQTVSGAY
jgi:hypothetical protein